jgi:hypothetical protein
MCFMHDFLEPRSECQPSADPALNQKLNDLPRVPGDAKCMHLVGDARICIVGVVLGTSLFDSPEVRALPGAAPGLGAAGPVPGKRLAGALLAGGRSRPLSPAHHSSHLSPQHHQQIADGGAMNLLRNRFADPHDIFIVNFGVWHAKEGDAGLERYRQALVRLGQDRQVRAAGRGVRGPWPGARAVAVGVLGLWGRGRAVWSWLPRPWRHLTPRLPPS